MLKIPFAPLALAFALASTTGATAQSFYYPDFAGAQGLNLLGDATPSGTALRLTANTAAQSSWVWRDSSVLVALGFDTTFSFRLTPPAVGTKAEGLAFVLHDDPTAASAQAGTAWGLGYGLGASASVGFRRSLVIEIDTFRDLFLGDTSDNELSIHTRGSQANSEEERYAIARTTPAVNLCDGAVHSLRVTYDLPGTIEVFVDGSSTPIISTSYSFQTGGQYVSGQSAPGFGLQSDEMFVGFCATTGTGTLTETAEILSWQWRGNSSRPPCYDGTLFDDVLRVEGQTGGAAKIVRLANSQAFGITMQSPPLFGAGAPYVLFASLAPQPGALGTQLGFGETCFPVAPLGATELVFADTIGFFPGLLPGLPTPHTFALPSGLITSPLDFTLQAVTFASATPLQFGISNAVDVEFRAGAAPGITSVSPSSSAVGLPVTITGSNFVNGLVVSIDGVAVIPSNVTATAVTFDCPAGVACDAQLTAINPDGQGATTTWNPVPTITSTALNSGSAAGNAVFLVTGTGFAPGLTVTIGGAAAIVSTVSAGAIVMRTPPGTPGVAAVVVTTPGGCSVTTSYTYL